MAKVYLVEESWGICSDCSTVAAFLDEAKCDKFIEEHMIPRNEEMERLETCRRCRCHDKEDFSYTHKYDEIFLLENECPLAKIGVDRNGKYCENENADYYSMSTNDYSKWSIDITE